MKTYLFVILACAMLLSSCMTAEVYREPVPRSVAPSHYVSTVPDQFRHDVYHVVAPGETLWRIAQMYEVEADTIKNVNRITNVRDIDIGRKLLIPGAAPQKHVITLYPSNKWKYIIIHHSATDFGSSEEFNEAHLKKGWQGVGYDFIIDNGTCGKADGQIETTPRWIKQIDGAHCSADNMNCRGIGICLVGNFSKEKVTPRQMESLVYLVDTLRTFYRIPNARILGHGQVRGAQTECPGKSFPWKQFRKSLK
ncbi:MAG: N-acetylmuramoyl-L-alanine amidase [Candidatus Omnitrophica bacterium]|nr:N-acetylmuramoyl-L-alanine amidase [Candidatus Omnitrophota bacterium]